MALPCSPQVARKSLCLSIRETICDVNVVGIGRAAWPAARQKSNCRQQQFRAHTPCNDRPLLAQSGHRNIAVACGPQMTDLRAVAN